jgi:hypothetical protein
MRTANQVCADFSDPAIAENNVSMKQRSGAFWRDQSDVCDYRALINDALRLRCADALQNNERSQCSR